MDLWLPPILSVPLGSSRKKGLCDIVDIFLSEGYPIEHGRVSALSIACKYGHVDIIDRFLESGCDVNFKYDPPILQAICSGNIEIINRLIICCVDVNMELQTFHYPLSLAIKQGSYEMVMYLLKIGADVNKHRTNHTNYDIEEIDTIKIAELIYKEQIEPLYIFVFVH